jgi:hypothetical protein
MLHTIDGNSRGRSGPKGGLLLVPRTCNYTNYIKLPARYARRRGGRAKLPGEPEIRTPAVYPWPGGFPVDRMGAAT